MIQDDSIRRLRSQFRGALLTPADGAPYDVAREVFNAMFDRRPALVAQPVDAADVAAAIAFARETNTPFAVRGGGHSIAGYSSCEGGLVIDLRALNAIRVDPAARRVRAQGGVRWGEFDRATTAHGLATTGGRVTSTGIAGLTLGSGSGWLDRLHGFTCDNLVSAELVTADGRTVRASETENPDLLWGLRGGGGNFGIVTEFEYRLHPMAPQILAGPILYRREQAGDLLRLYRELMEGAPRELSGGVVFMSAPPAPGLPPEFHGQPVVVALVAWFGDIPAGEKVIARLRAFGPPLADGVQPMPYTALQSLIDAGNPFGHRHYWRAENLDVLSNAVIDCIVEHANAATSPLTQLIVVPLGGAIADVSDGATALGGRAARWQFHCYAGWVERDDAKHIAWVKAAERALAPHIAGSISLNFVSEAGNDRVRAAFGEAVYARLVTLKDAYDPTNLFRLNQNIQPSKR